MPVLRRFGRISCLHREVWQKFRSLLTQFATESPDHCPVHISTAAHRAPSKGLQHFDTPVHTKPHTLYCTYFPRLSSILQMTSLRLSSPLAESRCILPFSSHFARPFSSTSFSFYKICLAPGFRVPYPCLSTPICA